MKVLFLFLCIISALSSCSDPNDSKQKTDAETENDIEQTDNDHNDSSITENDIEISDQDTSANNLEEGPYGIEFGDTAGDLTLPLETGEWNFAQNRSMDENYIFIFYRAANSESTAIWKTDMIKLFDNSPKNTHYFFLVDGTEETFQMRMEQLKETIDNSLQIGGGPDMGKRIHITTKSAKEINSWLKDWLEKYKDFFLGIDRFQKIRKGGSFHSWESSSSDPRFEFIYKEAELYNYEYDLEKFMNDNIEKTVRIKGIDGLTFPDEGWVKEIMFTSDFPGFNEPGRLFISLEQICESPKTCEWDRLQHLFLCGNENPETCTTEIGRWITTYGRSGKWLTEITELAPLLKNKSSYNFKLSVAGDQYENHLDFIFLRDESVKTPAESVPLFNGTVPFDENYNQHWEETEVNIPEKTEKVVILAYITGHGNGSEQENCAEFCKFESIFYVNGHPFEIDFDNAGTSRGCFDLVSEGTVPNQYGSWPFGRAGWCPGQDVKFIKIDVTEKIKKGEINKFLYGAFLDGEIYMPVITDPSGYRAEIPLSSYIVIF